MRVERVAPPHVALLWPKIGHFLRAALATQPIQLYDEWDLERALMRGFPWTLWIARDGEAFHGVIVTRIEDPPRARGCLIFACGGERMADWHEPAQAAIETYARSEGCRYLEAHGREGWLRRCDAEDHGRIMRKGL